MEQDYTTFNQKSICEYTSYDDLEDAIDFLKNPDSFRTFNLGLIELLKRKGYSGDLDNIAEMSDYLISKLRDINSKIERKTVYSWFCGDHRPKIEAGYRQQIYEICFALQLDYKETVWFFQHVYYDRAFNCHTINEAVFYYAFLNGLTYGEALSIIDEVIGTAPDNTAENKLPANYTQFVRNCIFDFHSTDELKKFLIMNKSNFNSWNVSALNHLNSLINGLVASEEAKKEIDNLKRTIIRNKNKIKGIDLRLKTYEQCGLLMKEILYDAKRDSADAAQYILEAIEGKNIQKNTFILDRLLGTTFGMTKTAIDVPYIVHNNFPSKKIMSDVLSGTKIAKSKSYDSIRKMIVLLDFYSFWVRVKIGLTDLSDYTEDERYEIYLAEANAELHQCGYEELYPGNPYDWIFLCSAHSDEPIDFFRSCISDLLPDLIDSEVPVST